MFSEFLAKLSKVWVIIAFKQVANSEKKTRFVFYEKSKKLLILLFSLQIDKLWRNWVPKVFDFLDKISLN